MQIVEYGLRDKEFVVVFTYDEFGELNNAYWNLKNSYKETMQRIALAVLNKDLNKISLECTVGEKLCQSLSEDIGKLYRIETPKEKSQREYIEHLERIEDLQKMWES